MLECLLSRKKVDQVIISWIAATTYSKGNVIEKGGAEFLRTQELTQTV